MKYEDAKRAVRLMLGFNNPNIILSLNDEDLLRRAAREFSGGTGENVLIPSELKRRLRSFIDRCANNNIRTLGEYFNHPIIKL